MVDQRDADQHLRVAGDGVVAQPPRDLHRASHDRDDRPHAHGLVDDRVDIGVGVLAGAHGVAQAVVGGGRAQKALEGPGQRVGGRLVAGEDEREQLVAHLLVGEPLAVLGFGLQQH